MELTHIADEKLVELSLSGKEAFNEVVRRYYRRIYNIAFRMTNNQADAEDITQETFLNVYRSLKQYNPKYRVSSWILRTATNVTLNYLKKLKMKPAPLIDENLVKGKDYARCDIPTLKNAVNYILDSLKPQYKMAFVLVYQEGCSYEEAAEQMDLPIGSFKTFVHKARRAVIDNIMNPKE
ncbi:MAG: sigma-70 family RNA polymerase sigma factor [Planctomycetes bacterium]|nr:sigma-70 family RNA polymerase sigma factor [Planctomycetota bacterium]